MPCPSSNKVSPSINLSINSSLSENLLRNVCFRLSSTCDECIFLFHDTNLCENLSEIEGEICSESLLTVMPLKQTDIVIWVQLKGTIAKSY